MEAHKDPARNILNIMQRDIPQALLIHSEGDQNLLAEIPSSNPDRLNS